MSFLLEEKVDQIRRHPKLVIAEDFEIAVQHLLSQTQKFHNGELMGLQEEDSYWVSLRILHRKQPGKSTTDSLSKQSLDQLVETAFESAKYSTGDPWFRFPLWKEPPKTDIKLSTFKKYESLYPSITNAPQIFDETYETRQTRNLLSRKQERFQLQHVQQFHGLQFSSIFSGKNSVFWLKEDRTFSVPLEDQVQWLRQLLEQGHKLKTALPYGGKGKCSFILAPAVLVKFLKQIAPWFYADRVRKDQSPLSTEKAFPIFSPVISLLDNGGFPGAANSVPFDMEGTLSRETLIVERGLLKSFLYDAYHARRENRLSTGNYLRLPGHQWPMIHASTFYIKPAEESLKSLLFDMNDGVLLDRLDSLELVPGSSGKFLMVGSGWRVKGGDCVEPFRELSLQVDIFDLFRRAVGVGNDLTLYGCFGAPSVLFEKVPL